MKVLKLELQAFGPFADRQAIDFRQLGDNPLFLINGPTGAGKSAILDAICFALYGKTATEKREAGDMRCDQADVNTLTEVTLDFALGTKQYRVTRSPQQQRPKARGEGFTLDTGQATLWEIQPDGTPRLLVARKLNEVTQLIEKLSGMNDQQFRQVMVLPQGKFRDLLVADSSDREKIFSQLFQTSIYKRIEDRLKQQASSITSEVKDLQNQIKGLLQGVEVSSEQEVTVHLEQLKPLVLQALQAKNEANKNHQKTLLDKQSAQKLDSQFRVLNDLLKSLRELEQQQPEMEREQQRLSLATAAQRIKPGFDEMSRLDHELTQLQLELDKLQQSAAEAQQSLIIADALFTQATQGYAEVDALKARKNLLSQVETRLQQRQSARQKAEQSSAVSQRSHQQRVKTEEQLAQQLQKREALQLQLVEFRQALSGLPASKVQLADLSRQLLQRDKLQGLQIRSHQVMKTQTEALLKRQGLQQTVLASRKRATQQESDWHSSQAVSLALELKPDHPCPVCGSTLHPAPAQANQQQLIVSKQQLDQSRAQADADQTLLQRIDDEIKQLEYQLKQLQHDAQQITEDLAYCAEFSAEQINTSIQKLTTEINTVEQQQQSITTISETLRQVGSEIELLQQNIVQDQKNDEYAQQQAITDQAALTHLTNEIPDEYRQRSHLADDIEQITALIITRTEALQKAQQQREQDKNLLTRLQTREQDASARSEVLQARLTRARTHWQQVLTASVFDTESVFQQSLLSEAQMSALQAKISHFQDQFKELQGRIKQQEKALSEQQLPDLEKIERLFIEQETRYQQADLSWNNLSSRLNQFTEVHKKLQTLLAENIRLEASYAVYGTLSDVATGKTANNISLQRFVLSVLLDDVLIQATQRLGMMSKGRYLLLRKDQRSKGRGAFGLDLDVEDAYTGKTRSVATLSGGESFMAALALALGLSDVVQAYAGGIKLDMLFIDEGFGSLDQESLDLAIRTLIDLQASGRMIGIISHVSELKEQMAVRLDVESSRTGSRIKLVMG